MQKTNALDEWMRANAVTTVRLAELLHQQGAPVTRQYAGMLRRGLRTPSMKVATALWVIAKVPMDTWMTRKAGPRKAVPRPSKPLVVAAE